MEETPVPERQPMFVAQLVWDSKSQATRLRPAVEVLPLPNQSQVPCSDSLYGHLGKDVELMVFNIIDKFAVIAGEHGNILLRDEVSSLTAPLASLTQPPPVRRGA